MSVMLETSPEVEAQLQADAARHGMDIGQYTLMLVQSTLKTGQTDRRKLKELTLEERTEARARLKRHFGKANSGDPDAANNERIDADLAREYGNNHEDQA